MMFNKRARAIVTWRYPAESGSVGQKVAIECRLKGDWKFQHLWIPFAVFVVGIFSPAWRKRWQRFSVTAGTTCYFTTASPPDEVVAHEARHALQWNRERFMFVMKYALRGAHRLEYEAEAVEFGQFAFSNPYKGDLIDHWADLLSGPAYMFAADPITANRRFQAAAKRTGVDVFIVHE